MRYPYTYTHNINANGNVKISNNWSLSFNSGYDFQAKEITQTSCTISRDLHCFNLSASLSPFGRWRYYNVTIRANASILQDLKYEQRSQTQSNIQWYQDKRRVERYIIALLQYYGKRKWLCYSLGNSAAIFFFNSQLVFNYQLISVSPCAFK